MTSSTSLFSLTNKQQWLVGGILLFIMIVTRSHIWLSHIQDASWAVFFLLGFYVRSVLGFPVFWLVAFAVDLLVIESKGGESFCFTASYPFLIPAYASLWFAGRWFAGHYSESLRGLAYFVVAAVVGTFACDVISSGGFYWFSGRFADVNMTEFAGRLARYMPMFMQTTMIYLAIAALIHFAVGRLGKYASHGQHIAG